MSTSGSEPTPAGSGAASPSPSKPTSAVLRRPAATGASFDEGVQFLPPYIRSLLRVQVPVVVSLAESQRPLKKVLELSPGSIIQFTKPCDEPLTLSVGNREIAVGEAVKVGDKFGLRITSMILPEEEFWALRGTRETGNAG
jgi:flagellar motor switch/type III secretory pathway protein FliN